MKSIFKTALVKKRIKEGKCWKCGGVLHASDECGVSLAHIRKHGVKDWTLKTKRKGTI